jgi:hypothetical protein
MKLGRFLSNYIRAADLDEAVTLTIVSVEVEKIGREDDAQAKLILYGKELDRGIVLGSKAQLNQLSELFGDETDEWVGKHVVVYNDKSVLFKGKRVGGVRFRAAE